MELLIKNCIKNQNILIKNNMVIADQRGSTPGIKWIVDLQPNIKYTIKAIFHEDSSKNICIYVADIYGNTIINKNEYQVEFVPSGKYNYIGIVFQNYEYYEKFILESIKVLNYVPDNRKMITYLADMDYANVMTEYSNIINQYSKKYQSRVICNLPHPFNYKLQHDINIRKVMFTAEILVYIRYLILNSEHVIFSDELELLSDNNIGGKNYLRDLKIYNSVKNLHITHPGSIYRSNYKRFNEIEYNKYKKHFYTPDLIRLNLNKVTDYEVLQIYINKIDKDIILKSIEDRFNEKKLIISHIPSSHLKGTNLIRNLLEILFQNEYIKNNYTYIIPNSQIDHENLLNLKMKSVIYIDQFIPNIGTFGVSSLESLSLGNITFASINNVINKTEILNNIIDTTQDIDNFYKILYGILHLPRSLLKAISCDSFNNYNKFLTPEKYVEKIENILDE